jgi:hypothetical protein
VCLVLVWLAGFFGRPYPPTKTHFFALRATTTIPNATGAQGEKNAFLAILHKFLKENNKKSFVLMKL